MKSKAAALLADTNLELDMNALYAPFNALSRAGEGRERAMDLTSKILCTLGGASAEPNKSRACLRYFLCSFPYGARKTIEVRTLRRMNASMVDSVIAPVIMNKIGNSCKGKSVERWG